MALSATYAHAGIEDKGPIETATNAVQDAAEEVTPLIIGGVLEFPIYSFYLGSPDINGKAFVPNFAPRLGPRLAWQKLGLRATFALPIPDREIERRGKSQQQNFIFNFYWKRYALDLYYQHFKGFYIASPFTELESHKPDRYPQLPDASMKHLGFNLYYKMNPTEFNFDNAFEQTQTESTKGSSWIVVPFYRYWKMNLGGTYTPGSSGGSFQMPKLASGRFDTLGGTWGRTQSWAITDNACFTFLWGVGPAGQLQRYVDSGHEFSKLALAGKLNLNGNLSWRHKEYSYGTQGMLDTVYSHITGTDIYSTLASIEFFFNKRL
jgi:hypothetical protein